MAGDGAKPGFAAVMQHGAGAGQAAEPVAVDLFGEALRPRGPGRPKGAINKQTAEALELIDLYGISPLQYLFSVFADQKQPQERRMQAAAAALPYVHRKQPQALDLGDTPLTLVIGMPSAEQHRELAREGIVLELEADQAEAGEGEKS